MQLEDFNYALPEQLIAQYPPQPRGSSRLLQLVNGEVRHGQFSHIEQLLKPGDLLVLNNTKVIKARLFGEKPTGGQAQVLVERVLTTHTALCQVKVSKSLQQGGEIRIGDFYAVSEGRQGQFYLLRFSTPVIILIG